MTRIRRLTKDEVPDEVRELFRTIGNQRGNVPNMFRIHAHRPEILRAMMAHLSAATTSGTVSVRLKELIATAVSKINQCHY
ncbi:MAG TPA: carboxymuconolactone decarboxylase family protein [Thermoanaerobaculia bacterium]|nr:carboxymuconolactone decarboxylase family protein [Thermoanaerobaculia bacterium]